MFRLTACFVLLVFVTNSFGQDFKLTSVFRSEYVFGNGVLVSDKPVIQTDLYIGFENGLWLDFWGSVPADFSDIGKDFATELYPTFGWSGKVDNYKLTFSAGYDDLNRAGTLEKTDFVVLVGEISRDFEISKSFTVTPFLHVETNFTFDGAVTGDTLPRFGSYYSWKLNDTLSLGGKAYVLYDPGILFCQTALIGSVEAALHWNISENVTIELPYARFIAPITGVSDGRKEEMIFGAGVSFKF